MQQAFHSSVPTRGAQVAGAAEGIALGTVALAPLAIGAVHLPVALTVAALGCLSFLLLALSLDGRRLHTGWLAPVLLVVNAAILLQLVPLPPGLVDLVAPATAALYAGAGVEGWHALSLDPASTAAEAAKSTGWLCLFAVLQHRATHSRTARRRVLLAVAGSGAAVAVIGLGHWFVGEHQALFGGLYEYGSRRTFLSTLGNTNNLAGFLALGGLVALGLAAHARRTRTRIGWGAAFVACVAAAILTASRGGAMALLAGLLVLPAVGVGSRRRREQGESEGWRSWATVGAATSAASGLAWWLYLAFPRLLKEVASVFDFDLASEEGKLEAYLIAWDAARAHPIFGIGRGAFESVHALYLSRPWRVAFSHAENEPLQALAELGLPLGAALVLGIGFGWLGLLRRGRLSWAEAGAAAGAFALLLQNLVDFSLQFAPGLALLALLAYRARRELRVPPRAAMGLSLAACVVVAAAGVRALPGLYADQETLIAAGADPALALEEVEARAQAARQARPGWYLPAEVVATRAAASGDPARALPWINQLLRLHPQGGNGHLLAGEVLAQLGRKPQALGEFRAAASLGRRSVERVIAHWPDDAEAVLQAVPKENAPALSAAGPVAQAHDRRLAIELLERLEAPDDRVLNRLFWLHRGEGDHEQALAIARRLEEMEDEPDGALVLQGHALASLKQPDEARARYEVALLVDRGNTSAIFGLADLALRADAPDEALEILERVPVLASAGAQRERHWRRARAFRAKNELIAARDELRLALEAAPNNRWYRVTLAAVLLDLNQLDPAAEILEPLSDWSGADRTRERLEKLRADADERRREMMKHRLLGDPG